MQMQMHQAVPQGFLLLGDPREEFVPCSGSWTDWRASKSQRRCGDGGFVGAAAPQSPALTICQRLEMTGTLAWPKCPHSTSKR